MSATMLFNNLITFSRGTSATLTGPTGLIQWAPMNLLTYSEQFDNAAWTKSGSSVTANSTTAPDGSATGDTILATAGASTKFVSQTTSAVVVTAYTMSVYAKAGTHNFVQFLNNGDSAAFADFDISSGTVGTVGAKTTAAIAAVGGGWFRCTATFGATATLSAIFRVYMVASASATYGASMTAAGTETVYLWGAQLELGTTATTYNSTTTKNLLGYSEAFDNAGWQKLGSSIVTGAQANPVNGLFNAQKLMEDTSTGIHRTFQTVTIAAGPHTLSFYAKSAGRDWIYINASGALYTAFVNVATGAVGATVGSPTVTMTPIGSGWYRVAMTYQNATAGTSNQQIWLASNSTTTSYTGDGNSGVYIWGAQLSDSGSLDPYVPTPGAAPTSAAYYGPRFDYDPVTLAPKGLLVEEARTNLLTYSEQFDNAVWIKSDNTVTANAVVSPDGSTNADTATPTGATPIVRQTYTTSTTGAYTGTIWLKSASNANVTISLRPTGAGSPASVVCAVTSTWQRFTVNLTAVAGVTNIQFWVEQFSQAVYLWGAQLEAGAFATSYIPTVASTVTRSADVATLTGSNFAPWYNQTAGTVVWSGDFATTGNAGLCGSDDVSSNNAIILRGETTNLRTFVRVGGAATSSLVASGMVQTSSKVAFGYTSANFGAYVNGSGTTGASGAVPLVATRFTIGLEATNNYLNGHIRSVTYYPDRLSNTQLQSLTT